VPKVQHKPIKSTSQGSIERSKRKPKCSLVWRTGQCPVHDWTVSGAPGRINLQLFTFGFLRRSSAIIHRTVRCATRLSGAPVEQRLSTRNGRLCKVNSKIQMSEQRVREAPDCPVCHRTVRCHKRTKPPTIDQLQYLMAG
jgi:hypothetical protein